MPRNDRPPQDNEALTSLLLPAMLGSFGNSLTMKKTFDDFNIAPIQFSFGSV